MPVDPARIRVMFDDDRRQLEHLGRTLLAAETPDAVDAYAAAGGGLGTPASA